mgnify:CR=1 FL=1
MVGLFKKTEKTWKEKVRDEAVPKIREYLEQYEGKSITPTVAIEMADKVVEIVNEHSNEGISREDYFWLVSYINLLMWGFSGAIVITPEE